MATKPLLAIQLVTVATILLLSLLLIHISSGFSASTTVKKRSGRNSFLQKLQHPESFKRLPKHNNVVTPEELHELGISLSKRKPGSNSFNRGWIQYRTAALDSIRYHLYNNLPHEADKSNFEELFFNLGVASDMGQMPSFEDAGARSGYALEFFCRARNLADLYLDTYNEYFEFPQFWLEGLRESPILGGGLSGADCNPYSMVSLGGGPGFDFVSAAVATSFSSYYVEAIRDDQQEEISNDNLNIHATILDYEEGWGDLVHSMTNSTQTLLEHSATNLRCDWGGKCDITKSIFHPSNAACSMMLESTNLWTCQYCVAENAHKLDESKYIFFKELFQHARPGSLFVLSEVHPRLWPKFYNLLLEEECCCIEEVGFNKKGRQMLFRKGVADPSIQREQQRPIMSEKDLKLLIKFEELMMCHERKIEAGWQRQEPKMRGAKE